MEGERDACDEFVVSGSKETKVDLVDSVEIGVIM